MIRYEVINDWSNEGSGFHCRGARIACVLADGPTYLEMLAHVEGDHPGVD